MFRIDGHPSVATRLSSNLKREKTRSSRIWLPRPKTYYCLQVLECNLLTNTFFLPFTKWQTSATNLQSTSKDLWYYVLHL